MRKVAKINKERIYVKWPKDLRTKERMNERNE